MTNIKRFILTLFSLILCAMLISCNKEPQVVQAPTPSPTPTPVVEQKPTAGGELIIPMPRNPFRTELSTAANPLLVNTEELRVLYLLIFEPLLRCDQNNRIVPGLAEKWSVDETGRVWTILLRENVVWHMDGEFLIADDVIYTLDLLTTYGDSSFYGARISEIESYEKENDRTIKITMKNPGAQALYSLAFPVVSSRDAGSVNGTGPYKLQTATETMVELVANEQWWRQSVYIKTVRGLARENNDVALSSYEAGLLNFVPTSNVSAGKYREQGITNVLDIMTQDAELLLFNHNNNILRNTDIRKAIAYGLDRGAIVSNVYMNRAAITDVPVPPDSFLYSSASKLYDYDASKARALLSSMGWEDTDDDGIREKDGVKLSFTLLVNDSTESTYRKNAASMVASELLKLGIEIVIESAKLTIGEEGEFEQRLNSGQFDLAMVGFNIDRGGDLSPYLTSGGARNYGRYQTSSQILAGIRAVRAAIDETDMKEAHASLQSAIAEELPFVTLWFRLSSIVYSADIKGMTDVRGPDIMRTVSNWYIQNDETQ